MRPVRAVLIAAIVALGSACASAPDGYSGPGIPWGPGTLTGYVSSRNDGCAYFIVREWSMYSVLERKSGDTPDVGDKIVGRWGEFGTKDLYNATRNRSFSARVEEYWISEEDAIKRMSEKCRPQRIAQGPP